MGGREICRAAHAVVVNAASGVVPEVLNSSPGANKPNRAWP
jgi:hypothetical protein